jgi:murein DD-endopeptidase MepM/ murein hydrolase activator NlpD
MYVRLAHREDTVFTQYFHLAAIPRRLRVGDVVEAGEVIGLLGETGIKHSRAHLHFTVSVRSKGEGPEQFIDPEPLVALWPVAVPVFGDVGSIARTHTIPGHPRGPYGKRRKKRAGKKRDRTAQIEPEPPSPSPSPSPAKP